MESPLRKIEKHQRVGTEILGADGRFLTQRRLVGYTCHHVVLDYRMYIQQQRVILKCGFKLQFFHVEDNDLIEPLISFHTLQQRRERELLQMDGDIGIAAVKLPDNRGEKGKSGKGAEQRNNSLLWEHVFWRR